MFLILEVKTNFNKIGIEILTICLFAWYADLWPSQHLSSAVSYPIHTVPGQASWAVNQYYVAIRSPVTDNCPAWISGRERKDVKMISWPNL